MSEFEEVKMVPGSVYRIQSLGSRDKPLETRGVFHGMTHISNGLSAIAIRLEEPKDLKGKLRIIPTHMILSIDILEAVEEEKKEDKETKSYYS